VERIWLAAILLAAATIRVHNIDFGLPSLWDDDEPFFLMFGLKLLKSHTLNPGWFGHPGTITIYLISLCTALVYAAGAILGEWADARQFVAAIYADPATIMVPQRMVIAAAGLASVWLTYLVGRRMHSPAVGLVAAAILALSPLHIDLSQLVRTDVQMTMFLLLSVYCALPLAEDYRRGPLVASAAMAGLAGATKWPGMLILLVPLAFILSGPGSLRETAWRVLLSTLAATATLLLVSPYLVLDYRTALGNLIVEGRPRHLSQTSGGPLETLSFYLLEVLPGALGWPLLIAAAAGLALCLGRQPARKLVIPTMVPVVTFLALISLQSIMWPRWAVPTLPFLALSAALAFDRLRQWLGRFPKGHANLVLAMTGVAAFVPPAWGAWQGAAERSNDTRDQAVDWIRSNVPETSSIAVETPAIALLNGPWALRFPLGDLGCIDPRQAMAGHIDYGTVSRATKGRININLSTMSPSLIGTCRAQFIVVNELDRYLAEAEHYPDEVANYRRLLVGMRQVALFRPIEGQSGGPVVRIFARAPSGS